MLQKALDLQPELIRIRRHLHRYPELNFQEHQTALFIATSLRKMGIHVEEGVGQTGVVAVIGNSGKTIAIRADMDALPITEETGLSFASVYQGIMHACGHDAHMAMALGAAQLLQQSFEEEGWNGRVKLIFQPSEECFDEDGVSGATAMIADGVLDDVDVVIAQHIWSTQKSGSLLFQPGYSFAAVDTFEAKIIGTGGHGAFPHVGTDPLFMLSSILPALYAIPARRIHPQDPAVISIGQISGGETTNVIPPEVYLQGTIRSYTTETRHKLWAEIEKALSISDAMGGSYEHQIIEGYPALYNDPTVTGWMQSAAIDLLGRSALIHGRFGMAAEDFAYMTQKCSGAMFLLGGAIDDGIVRAHHTPIFDIDESVLHLGCAVLAETAHRFVTGKITE